MNAHGGTTASRRFALLITAIATAFAMVGVLGAPSSALADVLMVIGHTGNPTGQHPDVSQAAGGSLIGNRTVKYVWTYEQLWPQVGTMTLDQSVDASIPLVITAIKDEPDPNKRIMGESQGAVDVGAAYNYFLAHPDEVPAGSSLSFVFLASPVTPNGGLLARFPGVSIPFLGVSSRQPTMDSQYQVVDAHWAYDMFSSAPMYLNNPLAWFNAFCGVYRTDASSLHGIDPDYTNPNYEVHTTVVGNTTYHVLVPAHLPMYRPFVDNGFGGIVDVIEPVTKVWVNAGYYRNDPTADPGTYHPAQLFMPVDNIVRAVQQTPDAIVKGLATIPGSIKQVLSPAAVKTAPQAIQQNLQHQVASLERTVKSLLGTVQAVKVPDAQPQVRPTSSVPAVTRTVTGSKPADSKKPKPRVLPKVTLPTLKLPKPLTAKPNRGPSLPKLSMNGHRSSAAHGSPSGN